MWSLAELADQSVPGTIELLQRAVEESSKLPAGIKAQAIRALGTRRRFGAANWYFDADPQVRLHHAIALGRCRDTDRADAAERLVGPMGDADPFVRHAAMRGLKRVSQWKVASTGLTSSEPTIRIGTLLAFEGEYSPDAVAALTEAAAGSGDAVFRAGVIRALAAVHRKPKSWDGSWFGTQPAAGPPPALVDEWSEIARVLAALRGQFDDSAAEVRHAAVESVITTRDRDTLPIVRQRFPAETDLPTQQAMLQLFGALADRDAVPIVAGLLRDSKAADARVRFGAAPRSVPSRPLPFPTTQIPTSQFRLPTQRAVSTCGPFRRGITFCATGFEGSLPWKEVLYGRRRSTTARIAATLQTVPRLVATDTELGWTAAFRARQGALRRSDRVACNDHQKSLSSRSTRRSRMHRRLVRNQARTNVGHSLQWRNAHQIVAT